MSATTGSPSASRAAHSFKVVVAGSFAVGKSTLIRNVSDTEVVGTEVATSGDESVVKATTTVGMEFGTLGVGSGEDAIELLLYGLPGQERFGFMWEIVSRGADGYLVLAEPARAETVREALAMVGRVRSEGRAPVLVALNRADDDGAATTAFEAELASHGVASVRCEALDPDQVRAALVELLLLVLEQLDDEGGADPWR